MKNKWKSVAEGEPILRKVEGTFRDVDYTDGNMVYIDGMDFYCQEQGIKRSEYLKSIMKDAAEEAREARDFAMRFP